MELPLPAARPWPTLWGCPIDKDSACSARAKQQKIPGWRGAPRGTSSRYAFQGWPVVPRISDASDNVRSICFLFKEALPVIGPQCFGRPVGGDDVFRMEALKLGALLRGDDGVRVGHGFHPRPLAAVRPDTRAKAGTVPRGGTLSGLVEIALPPQEDAPSPSHSRSRRSHQCAAIRRPIAAASPMQIDSACWRIVRRV